MSYYNKVAGHKGNIEKAIDFLYTSNKQVELEIKNKCHGASLVAQWLRICLPMRGTRVRALVWEDPTCRGATKPVRHNY